jgi:hypothetical protein
MFKANSVFGRELAVAGDSLVMTPETKHRSACYREDQNQSND